MESTAIKLAAIKSDDGGGEKKAGQDGTAEEEGAGEMKQLASQVNQDICGGRAVALGIFPEELWLKILEEYVHSGEDIRNVLLAFPQLDKLFQKKKAAWLFPLVVLPHLMTKYLVVEVLKEFGSWMYSEELLKLRLVSKRWKDAVERTLENHAGRHPPLSRHKNAKVGSSVVAVALPDHHFNYHRIRNHSLAVNKFETPGRIDLFLRRMGNFQGNPFPGKSVRLRVSCFDDDPDFGQLVARAVVLLERFGQHVLDLQIDYWADEGEDVGNLELYRNILGCLTLLPNLRSLIFSGDFFGARDPERDNFFGDPESQNLFPELPNLERFEWRVEFSAESTWATRMLETYGWKDGLRKLAIPLNLLSTVNLASYQSVNLTELHIFLDTSFVGNVDRIGRVVKTLPNHQEIRKLWLSSLHQSGTVKINELIRMLAELKFESVVLQDLDSLIEGPPVSETLAPAITVTSLDMEEMWDSNWSYEFLRKLPNLKFLSLSISSRRIRQIVREYRNIKRDEEAEDLEVGSFGKILTRYFMKAYDPTFEIPENAGIWKEMPSLKMLSLLMPVDLSDEWDSHLGVRFVRECGNQVFFGPRPDVAVKWDEEEVEDQVDERGIGLMENYFFGW